MISYLKGDATCPMCPGPKIVAHICNDVGGWGKGFVLAISNKWPEPERKYRDWYAGKCGRFGLGEIQIVSVNNYMSVCNMVAQRGLKTGSKGPPIRYDALEQCLTKLGAVAGKSSIHMPRIGCGLAGGKWNMVEPLIAKCLCSRKIPVFVYDY